MSRWRRPLALLPFSVLLVAAAVVVVMLWSRGSLNGLICDGECGPSAVATPEALGRDGAPGPAAARAAATGRLDGEAIEAAVREELGDDDLGPRVGFAAVDAADGRVVASQGADVYIPASTTKVLTGLAALTTLEPQERFLTRVVRSGDRLVLVGGGDPYLVTKKSHKKTYAVGADLATLARRTSAALRRSNLTSVRLDYDSSLFSGPNASPTWEKSYIGQKIVTPVSALWVDKGVAGGTRVDDPAKAAGEAFARLLEERGVEVTDQPRETKTPSTAMPVALVRSATVAQMTESMVSRSDNEAAEVLFRQAAIAAGNPATFAGGVATVQGVIDALDIDASSLELHDGSGLSRENRIEPELLAAIIATSAREARTASLVSDLPVGGFTGSLTRRFDAAEAGLGVVRAKTGTLTGVHSLAGYATDRSGTPIAFAVMTDDTKSINPFATEAALDRVTAALTECDCSL